MNKYGVIIDYSKGIDLDPFPTVPTGALHVGDSYIVAGSLSMLLSVGVTDIVVMSEVGAAFLADAVGSYPGLDGVSITNLPEVDLVGLGNLLKKGIVSIMHDYGQPISIVPGNVITEIKLSDVENHHKAKGRPPATVVVIQGMNTTELSVPAGYKPTGLIILEKEFLNFGSRSKPSLSLLDILEDMDFKGKLSYYVSDGLYYEVTKPEHFLALMGDAGVPT